MESVQDKTSSVAERATFAFLEANAREKVYLTRRNPGSVAANIEKGIQKRGSAACPTIFFTVCGL